EGDRASLHERIFRRMARRHAQDGARCASKRRRQGGRARVPGEAQAGLASTLTRGTPVVAGMPLGRGWGASNRLRLLPRGRTVRRQSDHAGRRGAADFGMLPATAEVPGTRAPGPARIRVVRASKCRALVDCWLNSLDSELTMLLRTAGRKRARASAARLQVE